MESSSLEPPYAIVPGAGIGPFRLGMTAEAIADVCRRTGLKNQGLMQSGLSIQFHDGRAVRIQMAADLPVSLGGERLDDTGDDTVCRLLDSISPPAADWTEREGLVAYHWEFSDRFVCAFLVYAPGWRFHDGQVASGT
jgi:hypothetical protein